MLCNIAGGEVFLPLQKDFFGGEDSKVNLFRAFVIGGEEGVHRYPAKPPVAQPISFESISSIQFKIKICLMVMVVYLLNFVVCWNCFFLLPTKNPTLKKAWENPGFHSSPNWVRIWTKDPIKDGATCAVNLSFSLRYSRSENVQDNEVAQESVFAFFFRALHFALLEADIL